MILYQLSVFLHIVSATIWIGGMLFLALVVVPATRTLPLTERAALFGALGQRFRTVGWACIGTLLVTGVMNSVYRGVTWETVFTAALWNSPFGITLGLKLGIVLVLLVLSLYHDIVIGPRAVRALEQAFGRLQPNQPGPICTTDAAPSGSISMVEAQRLRRIASMVGRAEAILALIVVALAIMLVRGVPGLP